MNIESNFNAADVYLEMAKEKVARHDYNGAISNLSKAYSHTRALLGQVFKLQAMKDKVEQPAREKTV